jgi:nitrogenase subunit NifH
MLVTCASAKGGVGKTTSAVHIAALLAQNDRTLLIDGNPNHSALKWAKRGELPFQVVDLMAASRHTRNYEHIVFDTSATALTQQIAQVEVEKVLQGEIFRQDAPVIAQLREQQSSLGKTPYPVTTG